MARTLYFVGGEDFDFTSFGSVSIDTTSSHRRSSFSRCSLQAADGDSGWSTGNVGDLTDAWFHFYAWMAAAAPNLAASQPVTERAPIEICDASGVVRLVIYFPNFVSVGSSNAGAEKWRFAKVDSAGAATNLGAVFSAAFAVAPSRPDQVDIQISNYATSDSGSVNVWINGTLAFSVSGVTLATDSATAVNELRLGGVGASTNISANKWGMSYSEVIVAAEDTRWLSVATLTPAADGNTDNWDTGGVTNINETTLDDSTTNTSGTAGQIQQYTVNAPPAGSFGVIAVCIAARAQQGSLGGPTKIDLGVRTNSSDYWSSDITLPVAAGRVANIFMLNPDNSAAFTTGDLGAAGFNIGMKSVA